MTSTDRPAGDPHAWVMDPPHPRRPDYGHRIAAWMSRQVQAEVMRAVPSLAERPLAAARVSWVLTQATLAARGRGEEDPAPLSMSAVVPVGLLDGALPENDIALLRSLQIPLDTLTPAATLTARLAALQHIGESLPVHFSRG